jgi:stage V sporulation protein SpoVS
MPKSFDEKLRDYEDDDFASPPLAAGVQLRNRTVHDDLMRPVSFRSHANVIDTVERPKGQNGAKKGKQNGKGARNGRNYAPNKGYDSPSEDSKGWNHFASSEGMPRKAKGSDKGHRSKSKEDYQSAYTPDSRGFDYSPGMDPSREMRRTTEVTDYRDAHDNKLESFKVSSSSDVRTVAGAISNTARQGAKGLVISACGAASINQAIKAIAIARRAYLENDDVEIDAQVRISNTPEFKHLVHIDLRFLPCRERPDLEPQSRQRVSGTSIPGKVAGAMASSLRNGEYVQVSVVGAEAMLRAVMAIAICINYIRLDPDPLSLVFWPDFDNIYTNGERRTGLSLHMIPSNFRPTS